MELRYSEEVHKSLFQSFASIRKINSDIEEYKNDIEEFIYYRIFLPNEINQDKNYAKWFMKRQLDNFYYASKQLVKDLDSLLDIIYEERDKFYEAQRNIGKPGNDDKPIISRVRKQ